MEGVPLTCSRCSSHRKQTPCAGRMSQLQHLRGLVGVGGSFEATPCANHASAEGSQTISNPCKPQLRLLQKWANPFRDNSNMLSGLRDLQDSGLVLPEMLTYLLKIRTGLFESPCSPSTAKPCPNPRLLPHPGPEVREPAGL